MYLETRTIHFNTRVTWPLLLGVAVALVIATLTIITRGPWWGLCIGVFVGGCVERIARYRPRRRVLVSNEGLQVDGQAMSHAEAVEAINNGQLCAIEDQQLWRVICALAATAPRVREALSIQTHEQWIHQLNHDSQWAKELADAMRSSLISPDHPAIWECALTEDGACVSGWALDQEQARAWYLIPNAQRPPRQAGELARVQVPWSLEPHAAQHIGAATAKPQLGQARITT